MSSSTAPITFSGSSTFASSFQQVIQRAVNIASLPIQSLQTQVSTLNAQEQTLFSLNANLTAFQSALQALDTAKSGAASAQVSDTSVLTASTTSAALPGAYTIQVDDPGSSTTTLSKAGLITVSDPASQDLSTASSFTLTLNGVNHTIANSGTSLVSLANSINAADVGAQATIVNIGSSSSPDYRLAITSDSLGADSIQLNDGSQDLLDTLSTGTDAQYKVNGSSTDVSSTSRQVALSPGLTVNLLAQSPAPVTITVSQNYSGLQSALSNFVSAYNASFDALSQNRGQNGGALSGDSIVFTVTNVLRQINQYTSSDGAVGSLADLGVTVDDTGHLSLDPSVLSGADPSAVAAFLGSVSGGGFLKTANDALTGITDSTTGLIPTDINTLLARIATDNAQITDEQNRVDDLQNNLQQQLSQADAQIATLESQKTYFQQLFTAEYGNGGTTGSGS